MLHPSLAVHIFDFYKAVLVTYYHSMPRFPRNIIQVSVAESIVHLKFKKGEYIFLNCSSYFYSQGSFGARGFNKNVFRNN